MKAGVVENPGKEVCFAQRRMLRDKDRRILHPQDVSLPRFSTTPAAEFHQERITLYHGIPINSEMIAVVFGILVWIVRGIMRGLKQISRRAVPPAPPPSPAGFSPQAPFQSRAPAQFSAPPSSQATFQAPPLSRPAPVQAGPQPEQARVQPRQPQAGGPAVYAETNRRDFERQEQDLFAAEPAGLGASLTSPSTRPDTAPNRLFGGTDDLVRAIILQEVLGPPLSRRKSAAAYPPASE